ncbi:MAG TPA: sulfur oxidation c-type cytochrome SoxA [Gammaproteobacteria bacterium]|nr:sulfur oxidation c-type cytochrome SoxA [Gammaproteobacteria bacterium]
MRTAIAGILLIVLAFGLAPVAAAETRSGYTYLTPEMQELQDDEFGNPGQLTVDRGRALFTAAAPGGKSCSSCHGDDGGGLDPGRIARYPVFDPRTEMPLTLRGQVLQCWAQRLGNPPLAYGDARALQLETFVRSLAHGETVAVEIDENLQPYYDAGEKLFHTRWGQVDIACHQCHDYHAGGTFRGQVLTQGQSNGFPVYRFTTGQTVGLQERITECLTSLRTQPYPLGSDEYLALEVYMSARSNGLKIETPAIRY